MQEDKALAVRPPAEMLTPAEVVIGATEQAKLLMDIVESRKIYQEIEGKKYLEVEAWQTIGAFNRVHALTDWVVPLKEGEEINGYEAQVSLWKDGKQVGQAIMTCGLDEFPCRGKEGQAKHKAARSAAQTWAESKAYRMNFAYIAVLAGYQPTPAEEMISSMDGSKAQKQQEDYCPVHNVPFFKRGKMKWWAHPIEGTDQWCSKPKGTPEPTKEAPEVKDEQARRDNFLKACKQRGWDSYTTTGAGAIADWLIEHFGTKWMELTPEAQVDAITQMREEAEKSK